MIQHLNLSLLRRRSLLFASSASRESWQFCWKSFDIEPATVSFEASEMSGFGLPTDQVLYNKYRWTRFSIHSARVTPDPIKIIYLFTFQKIKKINKIFCSIVK